MINDDEQASGGGEFEIIAAGRFTPPIRVDAPPFGDFGNRVRLPLPNEPVGTVWTAANYLDWVAIRPEPGHQEWVLSETVFRVKDDNA